MDTASNTSTKDEAASIPAWTPQIAIAMGSDSDKIVLDAGAAFLRKMGIPYESHIISAHRTPQRMIQFGRGASGRGIKVIIAAAGGAAHLPQVSLLISIVHLCADMVKGNAGKLYLIACYWSELDSLPDLSVNDANPFLETGAGEVNSSRWFG